jgi:hypothetical protein
MPSGGANKFTLDKVNYIFEKNGFKLLENKYISNNTPMLAICVCGNKVNIRLSHVQKGRKCQKCKAKVNSKNFRTTEDELTNFCLKNNCQFIKSWIKNKKTRIEYICQCGNNSEAYWTNFKKCPNCKKCGSAKISGDKCYMYDPDREAVRMRKKFRKICGQHIKRFMEATGQTKTRHTHELLGYTPQQLQSHILNHPDFEKCKDKIWHVDHIMPIQAFLDHNILDLKIINSLENLRPMPGPENLSKANKYSEEEFQIYLSNNMAKTKA